MPRAIAGESAHSLLETKRPRILWKRVARCVALASVAGLCTAKSQARPTVRIEGVPTCFACKLVTRHTLTLQDASPAPLLSEAPDAIAQDGRGRIFLALSAVGEVPAIYDRLGRFVGFLGRRGTGRGQFVDANFITTGAGDTVYVLDRVAGQLTVLNPSFGFVRSAPMPPGAFALLVLDRVIVVNASIPDASRVGLPLHSFDHIGNQVRSFGADNALVLPGRTGYSLRVMSPARRGALWAAPMYGDYSIALYNANGLLEQRLIRTPDWLQTDGPPRPQSGIRRPPPAIVALREDGDGLLWVAIPLPSSEWEKAVELASVGEGGAGKGRVIRDWDLAYDGIIEVLDPQRGVLLYSERFPETWDAFLGRGVAVRYRKVQGGGYRVEFHEMNLQGGRR